MIAEKKVKSEIDDQIEKRKAAKLGHKDTYIAKLDENKNTNSPETDEHKSTYNTLKEKK